MNAENVIFYLLGAMTLVSGFMSVVSRMIFRSAIYLLFCLMGVAGIYFWMQYEFIAAVQIVVYVGGITVLIIFSIFLTQQAGEALPAPVFSNKLSAALAAVFGLSFLLLQFYKHPFAESAFYHPGSPTMQTIGNTMLDVENTGYALPFELVSILLLAAMIGCIVIAMRPKPDKEN